MTSALWLMSPKSTIPVMKPSSSMSALSVVRSVWTTCARSDGQTGTTDRVEAVEHDADKLAIGRIPDGPEEGACLSGVLDVPQHRPLCRRMEEATQRPPHARRHRSPGAERGIRKLDRRDTPPPGQHRVHAHVVVAVGRTMDRAAGLGIARAR